MSAFGKIVASPFVGLGWIAGQCKNGYDAAVNATSSAASTVAAAATSTAKVTKAKATSTAKAAKAKAATAGTKVKAGVAATSAKVKTGAAKAAGTVKTAAVKTGQKAKAVALVATTKAGEATRATSNAVVSFCAAIGRGVRYAVTAAARAVYMTGEFVLRSMAALFLVAAGLAVTTAALLAVAVISLFLVALAGLNGLVTLATKGWNATVEFFKGEGGLAVADVLHALAAATAFCAAVWALAALLFLSIPALGVVAAEAIVLANAACIAACVSAGVKVVGFLIEESNTAAQVTYTVSARKVMPNDTYPGVVGFAPSAS